jgi:hypothetical protein
MTTRPLLTDEEIAGGAEVFCPPLPDMPLAGERRDVQQSFRSGARFARAIYETDREKLLAKIERLEGMVPKWVEEQSPDEARLSAKGWLEVSHESPTGVCYWLMVPPIPLPEKGSE